PNLEAPAPKMPDGHPDLSGVWVPRGRYIVDLALDLKPGDVSFQPWAEALYKHRLDTLGRDDPQAHCVLSGAPRENAIAYPYKIPVCGRTDVALVEYGCGENAKDLKHLVGK